MARLNLKAIEERITPLAGREHYDREIIFDLLLAYGRSKGNVTRLRNGSLNVADDPQREVALKNVVYFREAEGELLHELEQLRVSPTVVKFGPRFVIVTDRAYNLRPTALEHLLHRVFAAVRLDASIVDAVGGSVAATEWFVLPLPVIDRAIELIMSGKIVRYVYDPVVGESVVRPA